MQGVDRDYIAFPIKPPQAYVLDLERFTLNTLLLETCAHSMNVATTWPSTNAAWKFCRSTHTDPSEPQRKFAWKAAALRLGNLDPLYKGLHEAYPGPLKLI